LQLVARALVAFHRHIFRVCFRFAAFAAFIMFFPDAARYFSLAIPPLPFQQIDLHRQASFLLIQ
jgi:hypothetical protein